MTNNIDIEMKNAYSEYEAEQERASYFAEMREEDARFRKQAAKRLRSSFGNSPQQQVDNAQGFKDAHPQEWDWLLENDATNNFARSLKEQIIRKGSLSDKQLACIQRNIGKASSKPEAAGQIDLSELRRRFELALSSGIKRPKIHLEGLSFSLAGQNSRNAGAIYVKGGKEYEAPYFGKIDREGRFFPARGVEQETIDQIIEVSSDLFKAARTHGKKHNNCCFCSRDLTTLQSVALGYGPVCADRYGLPHSLEEAQEMRPEFFEAREELSSLNRGEGA